MSKQSEAKKAQGYTERNEHRKCSNCVNFSYTENHWGEKVRLKCKLGGFAVKASAICGEYWG